MRHTPIFCTGKQPLVYISGGPVDERETKMSVRWNTFTFLYQIPKEHQKDIGACPYCFAHFILDNINEAEVVQYKQ